MLRIHQVRRTADMIDRNRGEDGRLATPGPRNTIGLARVSRKTELSRAVVAARRWRYFLRGTG
jgi:hypothetical protein